MKNTNENQKQLNVGETLVNKKYTLIHKLYESQNSKIFVGAFMKNGKQVSRIIKVQQTYTQSPMNYMKKVTSIGIKNQISLLRHLFMNDHGKSQSKTGFPQMFQYGTERNHNYIVTALYGPNLAQLMKLCSGRFSARTTLLIALQIIDRIQDIHNKRYLYGGMSPQNFVIGTNKQSYLIYMINFSKSTVYKSKSKDVHIPYQHKGQGDINGNNTFISINQQLGVQSARRDDIQAFMYLILFMFKGKLPWMHGDLGMNEKPPTNLGEGIQQNKQATSNTNSTINNINNTSEQNRVNTLQIKRRIPPQALFKNLSFQMIDLMHYVKTLSFYERPDYMYIRKKLWSALMETDYQQLRNNIIVYDWNQRQSLDYQIYRDVPRFKLKIDQKQKDQITQNNQNQHRSQIGASDKGSANEINRNSGKKISQKQVLRNSRQKPITKITSANSNLAMKSSQKSKESQKIVSSDGLSKKIRKVQIAQQDDANVIDDDFVNKNQIAQNNQLKIQQKLKIINQIDELNLNQPLYKDNKPSQMTKSRFKSLGSQRKSSEAEKLL